MEEKHKEAQKQYKQSENGRKVNKKACKKYRNQLCFYNGEELTLNALSWRFRKDGVEHYVLEAKKYLKKDSNN